MRSRDYFKKLKNGEEAKPPQLAAFKVSKELWNEYKFAIVHDRRVDNFREWLENLPPWDGKKRLFNTFDTLFYMEKPWNEDHKKLMHWASGAVPMTAVYRTYHPGAQADECVVLQGPGDIGKTTYGQCLFPPEARHLWFNDKVDFMASAHDQLEAIKGRVVVEFGELAGLTRGDINRIKTFITRKDDGGIRLKHTTEVTQYPRMCAFYMNTNENECLPNDPSGNRRFVVAKADKNYNEGRVSIEDWMDENREQLWAEAWYYVVKKGMEAKLPRHLKNIQRTGQCRIPICRYFNRGCYQQRIPARGSQSRVVS